jgi:hypothetical protein
MRTAAGNSCILLKSEKSEKNPVEICSIGFFMLWREICFACLYYDKRRSGPYLNFVNAEVKNKNPRYQ